MLPKLIFITDKPLSERNKPKKELLLQKEDMRKLTQRLKLLKRPQIEPELMVSLGLLPCQVILLTVLDLVHLLNIMNRFITTSTKKIPTSSTLIMKETVPQKVHTLNMQFLILMKTNENFNKFNLQT